MAIYDDNLSDKMGALSVDDHWIELGLDDYIQTQLKKIKNDFESVFSWDIHKSSEFNQNLYLNITDRIQENLSMIIDEIDENEFNFYRFYLQLIVIHEDYTSKRYKESYVGIETIVKFMETCTFDESNKQNFNVYHHIAQATNAYISLTLKIDSENLLNDVKPAKNFNDTEKAAICAVKARIFMEYPPKGNNIALELTERALALHYLPEWLLIWLKAKKVVRHDNAPYTIPGDEEINAALYLYKTQTKPKFLIHAYQLFKEAGYINNVNKNYGQSKYFFDYSYKIAKKSMALAKDDPNKLNSILLYCLHYPKNLLSKNFIDHIISKLSNIKNGCVHLTIGRYYLKREKDYKKAKTYFSRGQAYGNFNSSLQLIKVECLLQSVHEFPYVQTLNEMYNDFQNPKRRVTILIHILMYYNFCENNPKEMMRYLKLYTDQDIEDTFKKCQLMYVCSLFNVGRFLERNDFLNVLFANVKELINNKWDEEEKKMIENTFDRFNKILNIQNNNFDDDNNL
eukprot:XP_016658438.1 PREDICTED: uncharacterized protein LOC107883282 [Acyrthosiphon pisum]